MPNPDLEVTINSTTFHQFLMYPAIVSCAGFAHSYLLSAAQGPAAVHIKHRLETDLSPAARLADIVREPLPFL
jgi:hypothetical protein